MKTFQGGMSGDYAEIIVDFKNKDVKLLNPQDDNKPFKRNRFAFEFNSLVLIGYAIAMFIVTAVLGFSFWVGIGVIGINYLVGVILPKYNLWLDVQNQKLLVGHVEKKVVVVNKVEGTSWQLPHEFHNNFLGYELYGDYKKYASKLHIKPKDYYLGNLKEKRRQIKDWEVIVEFTENPKEGRMEIEFV